MSTRAMIAVEGSKVKFYKHEDGYPEGPGVLHTLLPVVADFFKRRGNDPFFLIGRIVIAFGIAEEDGRRQALKSREQWLKQHAERGPELSKFGLDTEWQGDLLYRYVVKRNGTVLVQERVFGRSSAQRFKTIQRHPLPE